MNRASWDRFSPPLSPAGSSGLPKSTPPAHSWNQVRAIALESSFQLVTCWAVTSPGPCGLSQATSRFPVFLPHEEESGAF